MATAPSSRSRRRQPHPVRPRRRPVRARHQPGHADRRPRRAGRPLRPAGRAARRGGRRCGAQAQPRLQPDPRVRARQPAVGRRRRRYDVQQACGTGLEADDPGRQQDRARPDRVGHRRRRRHHQRRPDRGERATCAACCSTSTAPRPSGQRVKAARRLRPGQLVPEIPRNAEPRTGLSMGEHAAITAAEWEISRRGAGRADRAPATATWPPPTTAASSTTWSRRTSA